MIFCRRFHDRISGIFSNYIEVNDKYFITDEPATRAIIADKGAIDITKTTLTKPSEECKERIEKLYNNLSKLREKIVKDVTRITISSRCLRKMSEAIYQLYELNFAYEYGIVIDNRITEDYSGIPVIYVMDDSSSLCFKVVTVVDYRKGKGVNCVVLRNVDFSLLRYFPSVNEIWSQAKEKYLNKVDIYFTEITYPVLIEYTGDYNLSYFIANLSEFSDIPQTAETLLKKSSDTERVLKAVI